VPRLRWLAELTRTAVVALVCARSTAPSISAPPMSDFACAGRDSACVPPPSPRHDRPFGRASIQARQLCGSPAAGVGGVQAIAMYGGVTYRGALFTGELPDLSMAVFDSCRAPCRSSAGPRTTRAPTRRGRAPAPAAKRAAGRKEGGDLTCGTHMSGPSQNQLDTLTV